MKTLSMLSLIFGVLLSGASCAGAEGVWQCNVKSVSTVKINGRTTKGTDYGSSASVLKSDGSYTSTTPVSPVTTHGTYSVKGRTIKLYPNQADLVAVAEQACRINGNTCMVTGIQVTPITGKLNGSLTSFKGVATLKMSILFNGSILARTTSKGTSNCYRQSGY